jgi:hypothetical protein
VKGAIAMANTSAPFGFTPIGTVGGGTPDFRLTRVYISPTYATAIYTGDAVQMVITPATGFIVQAAANTTSLAGIFWGCTYLSTAAGRMIWSQVWPGSGDANVNVNVSAYVYNNPDMEFVTTAGATAIGSAYLYENVALNVGAGGNSSTGRSGMFINTPAATATLPFTITGFVTDPSGVNGTDITTGYNLVRVTFNNAVLRAGLTSIS